MPIAAPRKPTVHCAAPSLPNTSFGISNGLNRDRSSAVPAVRDSEGFVAWHMSAIILGNAKLAYTDHTNLQFGCGRHQGHGVAREELVNYSSVRRLVDYSLYDCSLFDRAIGCSAPEGM